MTPRWTVAPMAVAAALASSWVVSGCEDRKAARGREAADESVDPARIARALGKDAAAFTSPVDPAPPAGDLRADVERFTSLDDCVERHATIDPLVGDALQSIGYD